MKFFKALKEQFMGLFTKWFKKREEVKVQPSNQPQPKVATVAPVYPGDTTPEQLAENAARLTAGLAGNGTQGPRPDPIVTPGADTPEGRHQWELIQIKMNHALMGNGGPPLTDEQAEAIYQAQKNPKMGTGMTPEPRPPKTPEQQAEEAAAGYKPKKAPDGYVPLKNPYGDGAPWDVNAPREPDPAGMWHYPGDFGWMSRDEMYSKRSAWLYAHEQKTDTGGKPKSWGPDNPYVTAENDPNKGH